ncbi:septal ring lytic transglycosylase RlpA family protein [Cyanobium sp. ATX 6F1]|uniref:septal ring lytic transglycosylase RlpA family protein n=1 Tax=Cyanobium sp. ATX 6F1 TaxID=2823702 RepID=UPI0020CD02BD|nr:septal ring lytic transglycosylase RlpA family protein [Cyanobium sp. ATX 6F1]MCP9917224.1 septal ring lytic transglycosylase RlpA family protein [Cyanobium sp. ATX 6F1]
MRRTTSLGALALLLSGSSVLIPAMAQSGRTISGEAIASAQYSEELAAPAATTKLAIREVQEPAPAAEPLLRPITPPLPIAPAPVAPRVVATSSGQASWYGPGFFGRRTANGERFRPGTLTAAHRTLPFGTKVRVTNLWNGRTTVVRINDRGPFHGNRVIDLAHGAASQLGVVASGVAQVKLEVLR